MTNPPIEPDEEALAAFVGPSWQRYYRDALATNRRFNLAAAVMPFWLAWRGFFGIQLLAMVAYVILFAVVLVSTDFLYPSIGNWTFLIDLAVPYLILGLCEGASANGLLRQRARRAWARAQSKSPDRDATLAAMRRSGGGSVAGVIVVPLLAAAFSVWWWNKATRHDHGKAYGAAMKSDLRNLVTAEEAYFADHETYSASLQTMMFLPSTGVTITIGAVSDSGWNATAKHNAVSNQMCGIWVGNVPPPVAGATEGEPRCGEHRH